MRLPTNKACSALTLAVVFLLAQFHFCAVLTGGNNSTHLCPFCSTAAAAIETDIPMLGMAPAVVRLDSAPPQIEVATTVAIGISPRAPPAL
jgi:hypothetical protein